MKLFTTLSAAAVVSAQGFGNDFNDLNQLFASLTADLNAGAAPNVGNSAPVSAPAQARYVVASTSVTNTPGTTAPPTSPAAIGSGCWKCDAMSFAQCAGDGYFETCASDSDTITGRDAVCFLELRETDQRLQQLCTGCKSRNACDTLKAQNFIGSAGSYRGGRFADQCKSEWFIQKVGRRYGSQQSTCRTCFLMCDSSAGDRSSCFGGMNSPTQQPEQFKYPNLGTSSGELKSGTIRLNRSPDAAALSTVQTLVSYTDADSNNFQVYSMGIPTGVQSIQTSAGTAEITEPSTTYPNQLMWGAESTAGHGKLADRGDGNTSANMNLYWAIQDAPQEWWEMDLIAVARILRDTTLTGTTYGARVNSQSQTLY